MYKHTIGSLVTEERIKKKVSLRTLAQGVCAFQMLSKIEDNQCDTDKLLMDILLQRLGKSPDKLECIISEEEYKKIRARDMIEELILKGKASKAEYLLGRYIKWLKNNDYVQQMYYYRTKAYIAIRCTGDYEAAKENILKAIDITLPNWQVTSLDKYLISTYEMENLLVYGKVLYLMGEKETAVSHLDRCYSYINEHFTDMGERSKILPKCVWLMSLVNADDNLNILSLCEDGLELLRRYSIIHFMLPLMKETIRRYEKIGATKKVEYWSRFEELLEWLYENYGQNVCQDSIFINAHKEEYYLDYEIIRAERQAQHITQEELIEGIYETPVSLSNLENAKSSPTKKKFESLMQKLDINKRRYNTTVVTNSFEVLELQEELKREIVMRNIERAIEIKNILKSKINCQIEENARVIDTMEIILGDRNGTLSPSEVMERSLFNLQKTYNSQNKEFFRLPMMNELVVINRISLTLLNMKKYSEAIEISKKLLFMYKKSRINLKYHYRTFGLINSNLTIYFEKGSCVSETRVLAEKGIKYELICGKGSALRTYLIRLAVNDIYETQEEQFAMFRRGYDISELFYNENGKEEAVVYCNRICKIELI